MPNVLLIAHEDRAATVLAEAGHVARIVQRLPPRLAIVDATPEALVALKGMQGMQAVCEGSIPASLLEELKPMERVFADAWVASQRAKRDRPGEGLPWDAKGFEPPDP